MPAYLITHNNERVIVRANRPDSALKHFWRGRATVESLSGDDLIRAILDDKIPVEDATRVIEEEIVPPLPPEESMQYAHKLACPAASDVPIGKGNCKCPDLDL